MNCGRPDANRQRVIPPPPKKKGGSIGVHGLECPHFFNPPGKKSRRPRRGGDAPAPRVFGPFPSPVRHPPAASGSGFGQVIPVNGIPDAATGDIEQGHARGDHLIPVRIEHHVGIVGMVLGQADQDAVVALLEH